MTFSNSDRPISTSDSPGDRPLPPRDRPTPNDSEFDSSEFNPQELNTDDIFVPGLIEDARQPGVNPPASQSTTAAQLPPADRPDRKEVQALKAAISTSSIPHLTIQFLDYILRAQTAVFEQIYSQRQLPRIITAMAVLCASLSGIYGLVMGISNGPVQALMSCMKLPILFLLTAIICIPSLYTFNVLLGQRFRFVQTVALMVTTLGTTTVLLASLAPVAFFFTMTTDNYSFLLLMHVALMALCGVYGVQYLYRGCRYLAFRMDQSLNTLLLKIWIALYGVVGMQLGWRLRPFVGSPGSPLQLFRSQEEGNFYLAVWHALIGLTGG